MAKTSPSERPGEARERVKTESGVQAGEESASFRLISRFIYNHLQKKMNFQAQTCSSYQDSLLPCDPDSGTLDSERRCRLDSYPHVLPKPASYFSNPLKEASRSQILKLKNKLSLRTKVLQRLANESKPQRNRNRYANIDSYFDLSCLDSCHRGR